MNYGNYKIYTLVLSLILAVFSSACDDDDPALPDSKLNFEVASAGLNVDAQEANIFLSLSRAVPQPVSVTVTFTTEGVSYGEHFTTEPAAAESSLVVTIPANSISSSFKVIRRDGVFLEGHETITFTISAIPQEQPVVLGETSEIFFSFGAIVSEGARLQLNGLIGDEPGSSAGNSVFVDFSANQQTSVARTSWDLGFYGGEQFRVIINNTSGASAVMLDETDLNAVTISDADVGALTIPLGEPGHESFAMIDDVEGDINGTVIAEVAEAAESNKVYLINRAGGSHGAPVVAENLVKVRILRNAGGYTVQYAGIAETSFRSIDVPKSELANFAYISFGSGEAPAAIEAAVEPAEWDIVWTWSVYYGVAGGDVFPYTFSDLVFINHLGGAKAVEVMTESVSFEDFDEGSLANIEFSTSRNVIGSGWRATVGTVGVKTDRFYVVEDANGNIYKLKFVSFHSADSGTRGKPVVEYALVKKAD